MVLVLCALTLMAVDNRNPQALSPIRTAANLVAYPLLYAVDFPVSLYRKVSEFVADQVVLVKENAALQQQVQLFAAQQQNLTSVEQENERLRSMLNAAPTTEYSFSMAEVLDVASERAGGLITLDKGTRDGVSEKQVVLSGDHIYGQVLYVTPVQATVMQLIDRGHTLPVRNQRTGERALATGQGRGMPLELRNLPAYSQVKEGDIFVSSGLGGLFPADFPVAKVIPNGVEFKQGDPFITVKAAPLVDYESVREVLLVWKKKAANAKAAVPAVAPAVEETPALTPKAPKSEEAVPKHSKPTSTHEKPAHAN
ncbi:MAG: rod shape-determining protein MreC [Pseudomonadota bacterium]|jgi:rod shape-determining protein MreC